MIFKKFRLLLYITAILGLSCFNVKAFDWKPVGSSVGSNGFALDGGVYAEGDRIINTGSISGEEGEELRGVISSRFKTRAVRALSNTQFAATAADSTLNIYGKLNGTGRKCALKVDGDITLTAHDTDMTVNVKTDTELIPYIDPTEQDEYPGNGFSQIYFDVAEGKTITVNVDYNLEFKGRTVGARVRGKTMTGAKLLTRASRAIEPIDMLLTFKGKGQTIFKMADGTSIAFSGDIDTLGAVEVLDEDSFSAVSNNAAGTKVFITMEQTETAVNNGVNKVVFERKNDSATTNHYRDLILVGNNSLITYVSTDDTGVAHATSSSVGNFASVAFDPTNAGTGRMVLFIAGAYTFGWQEGFSASDPEYMKIAARFPFNDGSVVVSGHKVTGYTPALIRTTVDYSKPAGGQAFFRVVDDVAYGARDTASSFDPAVTARRGLLVINDVQSVSKRASDPYWDFFNVTSSGEEEEFLSRFFEEEEEESGKQIYGYDWSYSRKTSNVRNGFILGVNGNLDVYHNTFFDYVAGSVNKTDHLAENDFDRAKLASLKTIMKKNPAAFVVDGIDARLYTDGDEPLINFSAANPSLGDAARMAQVTLRGTGAALFRNSASSKNGYGYIYNFWRRYAPNFSETLGSREVSEAEEYEEEADDNNPLDDKELDYQLALITDDTNFNGYKLEDGEHTSKNEPKELSNSSCCYEKGRLSKARKCGSRWGGQNVVEVEGLLKVLSLANTTIYDPSTSAARDYASTVEDSGEITMPTLMIDYTGREVDGDGAVGVRPLTISDLPEDTYQRYNSPAMFFNNHASIYDTTVLHSDVTKLVDGVPLNSYPAVTGGERFYFANKRVTYDAKDVDRYRFPELRFYNSELGLMESLNSSGVRFVVKDIPGETDADGSNSSIFRFYDYGDTNDTDFKGFGRIFMLGSENNTMADCSNNWVTQGCYMNIFRGNEYSTETGATVSTIKLSLQNGNAFPSTTSAAEYDSQRAHHLFLMSKMELGGTNVALGWPTTSGDTSGSYPYANTTYKNSLVLETLSTTADDLIDLDALVVPHATLSIDGNYMVFGGFDKFGKNVKGPIERMDNQGAVFVNHGGKITTTGNYNSAFETIIANKVWNDYDIDGVERIVEYSGRVDLPHDQVNFLLGGGVQPYGFSDAMFSYREDATNGYVRLSFFNGDGRTTKADESGAEEVIINWFNTEGTNRVFAPGVRRFSFPSLTRSTMSYSAPIDAPDRGLYINSGDDIAQMKVAGATRANPFHLYVSGDPDLPSPGRVREFVSIPRQVDLATDHFVGEGDNARIYLEYNGRIGLGSRDWDKDSGGTSWTLLGEDHVQILPAGDGVIDVNSNLLIVDKNALLCTTDFGVDGVQRVTFQSEIPTEIRIPAGGELDLSSFGQSEYRQEISFDGKVRLVVEAGATIRFPADPDGGLVLYFNGESELIFQGLVEAQTFTQPFLTSSAANFERSKLMGKGSIWTNKNARLSVNGDVLVGVQSDTRTPATDLMISLARQSEFFIGTETVSGGAFEVGNPTSISGGRVDFSLAQRDPDTRFHIDRSGFFGLGAGVIDKHGSPNGDADAADNPQVDAAGDVEFDENDNPIFNPALYDATNDATYQAGWTVQPLNNVGDVNITLRAGKFEHNNVADGSSANASLMAIGPAASYEFNLNGPSQAIVKGGGNLMYIPAVSAVYTANIWDYAGDLSSGESYSIMASAPNLLDRAIATDIATAVDYRTAGKTFSFATGTPAEDFYNLMAFNPILNHPSKKVSVGTSGFDIVAGFVNTDFGTAEFPQRYGEDYNVIRRVANPNVLGGSGRDALKIGALLAEDQGDIDPSRFSILEVE